MEVDAVKIHNMFEGLEEEYEEDAGFGGQVF